VNIFSKVAVSKPHVFPLLKRFLILPVALIAVASAPGAGTQISADKPVINFRLPSFTPDGFRAYLVRGSEGFYMPKTNQINIKELTLTVFSGKADDKVTTLILSPAATVLPNESVVTGDSTIRVINDDFEATGIGWRYAHKEKKTVIQKKVRVTFQAELKNFLK
jgi:lipopolysaccharide export system protein LptC